MVVNVIMNTNRDTIAKVIADQNINSKFVYFVLLSNPLVVNDAARIFKFNQMDLGTIIRYLDKHEKNNESDIALLLYIDPNSEKGKSIVKEMTI